MVRQFVYTENAIQIAESAMGHLSVSTENGNRFAKLVVVGVYVKHQIVKRLELNTT